MKLHPLRGPIGLLSLSLSLLVGCGGNKAPVADGGALAGAPDGPLVATVNGEAISEPLLVVYARGRGLDPAQPAMREQALSSLIENVLLAQDARSSGLLEKPEVKAEATLVRLQQLAGRTISSQRERIQVGDEQIQALYDQERARAGDTEWKIDHILFADEAAAQAALVRATAADADFDALIGEYAVAGAKQAKSLDWSNAAQIPEQLVTALKQLKDGEIAPVVIKTSFGWHLLRRVASRPFTPPSMDSVRDGARRQIIDKALKEYVDALRNKADIVTGASPTSPAG